MPKIELELSAEVHELWRRFLGTTQAGRLVEVGLLGDWVAMGFMANVDRFLKAGAPDLPAPDDQTVRQQEAAQARRGLSKAQKRVLPAFNENETVTAAEVARVLGLELAAGQALVRDWLEEGFLAAGPARGEEPAYVLSQDWQNRNLAANRPSLNVPRMPHLMFPGKFKPGGGLV